jgi:hypothetical protein
MHVLTVKLNFNIQSGQNKLIFQGSLVLAILGVMLYTFVGILLLVATTLISLKEEEKGFSIVFGIVCFWGLELEGAYCSVDSTYYGMYFLIFKISTQNLFKSHS